MVLVAFSLFCGAAGYHFTEGLPWLDALLNTSIILTGIGPVDKVQSPGGRVFAIAYSLFAGIVFLSTAALILTPISHRILHIFKLQVEGDGAQKSSK